MADNENQVTNPLVSEEDDITEAADDNFTTADDDYDNYEVEEEDLLNESENAENEAASAELAENQEEQGEEGEENEEPSRLSKLGESAKNLGKKLGSSAMDTIQSRGFLSGLMRFLIWLFRVIFAYNLYPMLCFIIYFYLIMYVFFGIYMHKGPDTISKKIEQINEFTSLKPDPIKGCEDEFCGKSFWHPKVLSGKMIKIINKFSDYILPFFIIGILLKSNVVYNTKIKSSNLRIGLTIVSTTIIAIIIGTIGYKGTEFLKPKDEENDYFDQYEDSTQDPAKPDDEIEQLKSLEKEINY